MIHIDRELLRRYLSGEVGRQEAERVEAWLREDPERWRELATLDEERTASALGQAGIEQAAGSVWERLRREVGDEAPLGNIQGVRPLRKRGFSVSPSSVPWALVLQVAAALVLAVGAGAVTTWWLRSREGVVAPGGRVVATEAGDRATLRLPDGTSVMLGVASTLRYPASFVAGPREVSVDGEAYFDVVHDPLRPFVVRAGQLVAKDLGTQFTVRFYPDDHEAQVVVRKGVVAIQARDPGSREAVVTAGQLGRVGAEGEATVEPADTGRYFAWTEGRLVLDQVPLGEALPELERWFDLEFRVADSTLAAIPLSATLKPVPTSDALNSLAASLGLRQRRVGRTVTLYSATAHR